MFRHMWWERKVFFQDFEAYLEPDFEALIRWAEWAGANLGRGMNR